MLRIFRLVGPIFTLLMLFFWCHAKLTVKGHYVVKHYAKLSLFFCIITIIGIYGYDITEKYLFTDIEVTQISEDELLPLTELNDSENNEVFYVYTSSSKTRFRYQSAYNVYFSPIVDSKEVTINEEKENSIPRLITNLTIKRPKTGNTWFWILLGAEEITYNSYEIYVPEKNIFHD